MHAWDGSKCCTALSLSANLLETNYLTLWSHWSFRCPWHQAAVFLLFPVPSSYWYKKCSRLQAIQSIMRWKPLYHGIHSVMTSHLSRWSTNPTALHVRMKLAVSGQGSNFTKNREVPNGQSHESNQFILSANKGPLAISLPSNQCSSQQLCHPSTPLLLDLMRLTSPFILQSILPTRWLGRR